MHRYRIINYFMVNCDRLCLQYCLQGFKRLVIPLSLDGCNTATNKAAYASQNNDNVRHRPSRKAAFIAYSGVC